MQHYYEPPTPRNKANTNTAFYHTANVTKPLPASSASVMSVFLSRREQNSAGQTRSNSCRMIGHSAWLTQARLSHHRQNTRAEQHDHMRPDNMFTTIIPLHEPRVRAPCVPPSLSCLTPSNSLPPLSHSLSHYSTRLVPCWHCGGAKPIPPYPGKESGHKPSRALIRSLPPPTPNQLLLS